MVKILVEKWIGIVVIFGDGKMVDGILLECDIVCDFVVCGVVCMEDKVDNLMMFDLVICGLMDSVDLVLEKMIEGCFCYMLVVEGCDMVGFVMLGDVVKV